MRVLVVIYIVLVAASCRTTNESSLSQTRHISAAELAKGLEDLLTVLPDQNNLFTRDLVIQSLSMNDAQFKIRMNAKDVVDQFGKEEALNLYQSIISTTPTERIQYLNSPYFLIPVVKGQVPVVIFYKDQKTTVLDAEPEPEIEAFEITQEARDWASKWARKFLIDGPPKAVWQEALSKLSLTREQKLILLSRTPSEPPTSNSSYQSVLLDFVLSKFDLEKAIFNLDFEENIQRLTKIKGARYDNDAGTVLIKNSEDSLTVSLMAQMLANAQAVNIRSAIGKLPKELRLKLLTDTNTLEASSRVEPIDLIRSGIKAHLSREFYLDSLSGWSSVKTKRISELTTILMGKFGLLGKDQRNLNNIYIVRGFDQTQKRFAILCLTDHKKEESIVSIPVEYHIKGDTSHLYMVNFESGVEPPKKFEVVCGNKIYDASIEVTTKLGQLPKPTLDVKQLYRDKKLHIATSIALVNEISLDAIVGAISYFSARGFLPYSYRWIPDMKTEFRSEFVNQWDAFIPASHNHQVLGFGVGTSTSLRIDFASYKTGRKILVSVYFPPYPKGQTTAIARLGPPIWQVALQQAVNALERSRPSRVNSDVLHLTPPEVTGLFCERRKKQRSPLVVLTVACNVTTTIHDWMSAYRKSHFDDKGKLKPILAVSDVPIIIAPDRGFNTNSGTEIIDHLEYPLALIESLAAGDSIEKALAKLNSDRPKSWMQKVVRGITRNPARFDYSGVANTEHDHYFNLGEEMKMSIKRRF